MPAAPHNQAGEFEFHGWWGETEKGATVQCVHCSRQWIWTPGSGRTRGWCMKCNGFVCGPSCEKCVHYMQKIENVEAGLPEDHTEIKIYVPPGIDDVTGN